MLKLLALFGLLAVALGSPLDGKIVGGLDADIIEFPWQVSFGFNGHHFCGGSIINKEFILTAAHCTDGKHDLLKYMTVRAGSTDSTTGGQLVKVSKIIQHESYNNDISMNHDIAMLKLETPLIFGTKVQSTVLETRPVNAGVKVVVSGWGVTYSGGINAEQFLRKVTLDTISEDQCMKAYGKSITSNMLCTFTSAKDACQGDSGGPLVKDAVQIGVVSWGVGCAEVNHPGVFTKVSNYIKWIRDNMY